MPTAAIALREVTKRYGETVAVDRLSLQIQPGSFTTLLGPSGCGKTTLLRLIAGFLTPDAGDIDVDDRSVVNLPPYKRPTATVFQEYALFPHMTVFENIAYGLRVRGLDEGGVRARVGAVAGLLGINALEDRAPHMLSGGQQQRVALARALVVEPRVLLMDEPLSNLDAKLRGAVRAELRALHQRLGITTLYVTHDQEEALFLSDWIAVMREGRIVQYGTPQDVYDRPVDPFVADFVGLVNFLDGVMLGREGDQVVVRLNGIVIRVTDSGALAVVNQRVRLAVRPTALAIALRSPGTENVLQGTLGMSTYLGTTYRYFVTVGDRDMIVDQPSGLAAAPGTPVYLFIPADRAWVFSAREDS